MRGRQGWSGVWLLVLGAGCGTAAPPDAAVPGGPAAGVGGQAVEGSVADPVLTDPEAAADPGPAPQNSREASGEASAAAVTAGPGEQASAEPAAGPAPASAAVESALSERQFQDWARALMGADAAARRAAADDLERAVGQLPRAAQLDLLRDPSVNRRRCIAFYLVDRFDPADAATTGALLEAVADADPTVRHVALAAARRMAPAQLAGAVGRLGSLLAPEREDAAHRAAVARLLGGLGADAREALPALAQAQQKDPEAAVRSACLVAVTRIAEPAAQVEALRRSLTQDADPTVRGVAVVRLGKLGPAAAAAVPELAGTLDRADESLAPKAVEALIAIGAPAVPALIPRLKSPQATTRICAIVALGKIGPEAAAAAQPLEACMNDEDPQVRQWAAVALQRIRAPR